jgi:hypothetical protein
VEHRECLRVTQELCDWQDWGRDFGTVASLLEQIISAGAGRNRHTNDGDARHPCDHMGRKKPCREKYCFQNHCFRHFCLSDLKEQRGDLKPSMVAGKKIDFFRHEPGSVYKPAIGDDVVISKLEPDVCKAMSDPGEEDALCWARYSASSFETNQSRQFCANPYHKDIEPKESASNLCEAITLQQFVKLVEVNWPKGSTDEDVEAYLNRTHFVLLTDNWIYYRFVRSGLESLVDRMPWPTPKKPDLFISDATNIL